MRRPGGEPGAMQFHEVSDVLRDDRASLIGREGQELPVREAVELGPFAGSVYGVAAGAELASDLGREMLVQQEPQFRMARSRSAAANSRSAIVAWRSSRSSISVVKAA